MRRLATLNALGHSTSPRSRSGAFAIASTGRAAECRHQATSARESRGVASSSYACALTLAVVAWRQLATLGHVRQQADVAQLLEHACCPLGVGLKVDMRARQVHVDRGALAVHGRAAPAEKELEQPVGVAPHVADQIAALEDGLIDPIDGAPARLVLEHFRARFDRLRPGDPEHVCARSRLPATSRFRRLSRRFVLV